MISPEEVKQKAENWYKEVLQAEISGTVFFPKEIAQIGAFKQHEVVANLTEISRQFENLINKSKEKTGSGYRLEWEERNFRTIGKNRFINKIIFDCQLDYLKFLGREKDFNHFKKNVEKLLVDFPDLKHWVIQNPFRIIDNKLIWDNLILVLRYFKDNHIPNKYYIRELPIGIHTKFIEENKSVLYELLSIVFPPHLLKGEFF